MSVESIRAETFIREYTRELHNKNASVFAGAGLSMASGYVDWKGLLRQLIQDLQLNPDDESDLVTLAQYHCNQVGGKGALTQTIFNHFAQVRAPMINHKILSSLPIQSYWTTNYDKLIETALIAAKKVPDVKYTEKHLTITRLDRDVLVYKMHGDVDHPADAVISKDDYESYSTKMGAYVAALRGDLIERTFLFLGISFTDPNLDYILSRVRVRYTENQRHHYSIQKKASKAKGESDEGFRIRELKQHYFIKDLKRFGIQTVLVDDYSGITELLQKVADRYRSQSILISGAANDFGSWDKVEAENFLHKLSRRLASDKCRIVTGFGLGVGNPIINGALDFLNHQGKTISDEDVVMRPFPQVATGEGSLADQWRSYRQQMIDLSGIAIFVFGNKLDTDGNTIASNGMQEEFDLAVSSGLRVLPIGSTGFMAEKLWNDVIGDFDSYFAGFADSFKTEFYRLGDKGLSHADIIDTVSDLVRFLQMN